MLLSTRRQITAWIAANFAITRLGGQTFIGKPFATGELRLTLVAALSNTAVLDISPDGRSLLAFAHSGGRRMIGLQLINPESGKVTRSIDLPVRPDDGGFFREGTTAIVRLINLETSAKGSVVILWDVTSGRVTRRIEGAFDRDQFGFSFHPLEANTILGLGHDRTLKRGSVLALFRVPDFEEIARTPHYNPRLGPGVISTRIKVADNRKTFAYALDNEVFCRSTKTLEILWRNQIKMPSASVWINEVGISPDGTLVTASETTVNKQNEKALSVIVLDGADGSFIKRIPVRGDSNVAFSSDNRLIACGHSEIVGVKGEERHIIVEVVEVATGRRLATIMHDRLKRNNKDFLSSGVGVQFSPDGRYLVTKGFNSRVWRLPG